MTVFEQMEFYSPVLRINNREENIDFYQNTLGYFWGLGSSRQSLFD